MLLLLLLLLACASLLFELFVLMNAANLSVTGGAHFHERAFQHQNGVALLYRILCGAATAFVLPGL